MGSNPTSSSRCLGNSDAVSEKASVTSVFFEEVANSFGIVEGAVKWAGQMVKRSQ